MSRHPIAIILAVVLALGTTEGLAFWWMHPAPAGSNQPILVYRPQMEERGLKIEARGSKIEEEAAPPSLKDPLSPILDPRSSAYTPLPEVYAKAAPMLRCSGGQVQHVQLDDDIGLHLAFFEWDGTDTGSVLEAFRHVPEACMGSIGMTLLVKEPPILYQVGGETLSFDHTLFREPGQTAAPVHAFRAVWVAGMTAPNPRAGLAGDTFDHLRSIRLKSALTRFRPAHARVIQGAVRGATSGDAAWQAFVSTMLVDLQFENR